MEIWKEFGFEAAHRLPNVPAAHKCARHAGKCTAFTRFVFPKLSKSEPLPVGFAIPSPEDEDFAAIFRGAAS